MKLGATLARFFLVVALFIITASIASSPAQSQIQPADSVIKAVLYDLDRVGKQLPTLTPQRKANIKRLMRSLDLAEQRLASESIARVVDRSEIATGCLSQPSADVDGRRSAAHTSAGSSSIAAHEGNGGAVHSATSPADDLASSIAI